ncbi:hypothetical protein DFP72DRAFT_854352 [Ephemerocybe angulata]|uniref:Uncharacterized protein n=1 Tax=Ephemerocybe angulata TaxID=980116 RepID=A0A8H6HKW4_9AGAR|nr:hypothetical protein DFP72DRAFT_854352 [Tulosesus angulatus]
MPCSRPDSPRRLTKHFLRQVEARHIRTPTSSPQILQWDPETKGLNEWYWPYDDATEAKLAPSLLQDHCRTHIFRAPCCLCSYLEGGGYTESRIGLVETRTRTDAGSSLNGEYVATCAINECGYFATPLPKERLLLISEVEDTFRDGDGLFQIMPSLINRGAKRNLRLENLVSEPLRSSSEADESPSDGDTEIVSVGEEDDDRDADFSDDNEPGSSP